MDTDWLNERLLANPGAVKDYKAEWEWRRYMVGGKLFAALLHTGETGDKAYANHPMINLKCDPLESEALRGQYPDILPGYYSNKSTWISVRLDGQVPRELLEHLCDASYQLVTAGLPKRLRAMLGSRAPTM